MLRDQPQLVLVGEVPAPGRRFAAHGAEAHRVRVPHDQQEERLVPLEQPVEIGDLHGVRVRLVEEAGRSRIMGVDRDVLLEDSLEPCAVAGVASSAVFLYSGSSRSDA